MSGKYHSEWLLIISLVCFEVDARKSLPEAFVSQLIINTESFTQYITHTSGSLKNEEKVHDYFFRIISLTSRFDFGFGKAAIAF